MFNLIPPQYTLAVKVALVALLLTLTYFKGRSDVQVKWDLANEQTAKQIAELQAKQAEVTTKVVTEYITKVQTVKQKGDTIVKYVDRYITQEQDSNCVIGNNVVSLHDAAAENRIPTTAEVTDARASEVKISELTKAVTDNYGTCNQIREQVIGLQNWIREQHATQ